MSKAKGKAPAVESISLTFDLHDLPTAQHRAGLAGLIFQVDAMVASKRPGARTPKLGPVTATSATITFTPESMSGVFDELYAAKTVEAKSATKWPGDAVLKEEKIVEKPNPKTGKMEKHKVFIYDVVQPQAPALAAHLGDGREGWLDLWRQMIWAIPRGGNNVRSRAPFLEFAERGTCGEGAATWESLRKSDPASPRIEPISGALMLGAQAVNAEGVPFAGRVDQNLLLHFWQVVVHTFVPQVVSKKDGTVERAGYSLAIPDVADLLEFRAEFPEILQSLAADTPGHTPSKARLDLPQQAGLEVLRMARRRAMAAARAGVPGGTPEAVESAAIASADLHERGASPADTRGLRPVGRRRGGFSPKGPSASGPRASAPSRRITCSSSGTT